MCKNLNFLVLSKSVYERNEGDVLMRLNLRSKKGKTGGFDSNTRLFSDFKKNYQLYLLILIPLIWIIVFSYVPMYGAQIAFRKYNPMDGILGSEWIGFENFIRFFKSPQFDDLLKNTLSITIYSQIISIPFPIILAIGLNYCRSSRFKKAVQMITYLPHFLSTVIIISLINMMFGYSTGLANNISEILFDTRINYLGTASAFPHLYVWSGVWQSVGWSSILYVSALAGVDLGLRQAAKIDGASQWKRVWHIDIPCILPTIAIMIIMSMGSLLTVGFDKTFLMQNSANLEVSEVLSTFIYKRGIGAAIPDYSYPSAIGLFSSIVTFVLVMISNRLSNKMSGYGLW